MLFLIDSIPSKKVRVFLKQKVFFRALNRKLADDMGQDILALEAEKANVPEILEYQRSQI